MIVNAEFKLPSHDIAKPIDIMPLCDTKFERNSSVIMTKQQLSFIWCLPHEN